MPEIAKVFNYTNSDWNKQIGWEISKDNDKIFIWFSIKDSDEDLQPKDFDKFRDNEITFHVELNNGEEIAIFDNVEELCEYLKN